MLSNVVKTVVTKVFIRKHAIYKYIYVQSAAEKSPTF